MGKLTIEIPEGVHHHLRIIAATRGVSIKEFVLEKLMPELDSARKAENSLKEMADAWVERSKEFKLERGGKSYREIAHEGHQW